MTTYTAPRAMQNPKTAFIVSMMLVFLVGAVAGALVMNFGPLHRGFHRTAFWTDPGKDISLRHLQKELNLTPAQTEQLKTVLDDFSRYYQDVLATGKTGIYKILNADQRRKFDRLMNEPPEKR